MSEWIKHPSLPNIPAAIEQAAHTLHQTSGLSLCILYGDQLCQVVGDQSAFSYLDQLGQMQLLADVARRTSLADTESQLHAATLSIGNLASALYMPLYSGFGLLIGPYRTEAPSCPMADPYFKTLGEEERQHFVHLCSKFPLKTEVSLLATAQAAAALSAVPAKAVYRTALSSREIPEAPVQAKNHNRMIKPIFTYVQETENPNVELMIRDLVCNGNAERAIEVYQKSLNNIAKPIAYTTCPKMDEVYSRIGLLHSIYYKMVECSVDHQGLILIKNKYLAQYNRTKCTQEMDLITMDMFHSFAANAKLNMQIESYTELIQKAIVYIYDHSKQKISLKDVAAALHVNACYLSSIFKKETGKSLTIFITEIKVEEAKRLLQSTNFPITTICYEIGFDNPSYFTEVFKKMTGVTPKDFKQQQKSAEAPSKA